MKPAIGGQKNGKKSSKGLRMKNWRNSQITHYLTLKTMQVFSTPIDHLEILMTRMAELSTAHRSAAAARYIQQREKLGRSEQYAAISGSINKLIENHRLKL